MSEELPEGWIETDLGSVIDGFEAGRNLRANGHPARPDEFGVLKISAVTWGAFRPSENKALLPQDRPKPHEQVRAGDLLISRANTSDLVGAVVLVDRDYPKLMLPDKLLRIRVRADVVDRRYLLYALRSQAVRDHFTNNATGTSDSMRNLAQPKIAAAPIRIPPLAEQHRIVAKVEELLAQVNAAKDHLAKVPTTLKRFRQSVLAAACSGRLTEDWRGRRSLRGSGADLLASMRSDSLADRDRRARSTVVELALEPHELPPEWAWASTAEVCVAVTDGDHQAPPKADAGVPFVVIGNLSDGRLDLGSTKYVPRDYYAALDEARTPRRGDVLYSVTGSFGIAVPVETDESFCFQRHIALLRPHPHMNAGFLAAVLRSPLSLSQATQVATGIAQLTVPLTGLRALRIPVPPPDEQHEITSRVTALFAQADALEACVADAILRTAKLSQSILAKAFRGELVPTEAELALAENRDYETAEQLLARVRASSNDEPRTIRVTRKQRPSGNDSQRVRRRA